MPVASFRLILVSFHVSSHQFGSLKQHPVLTPQLLSGGLCPESHRMRSVCRQGCGPSWRPWDEGACIQVTQVRSVSMVAERGGWSPGSGGCPTPRLQACFLHPQSQQSLSCFHHLCPPPLPHPTITSLFCSFPAFKRAPVTTLEPPQEFRILSLR